MKRAIHCGAGKIGRGFIGALLSQAGYEVCFAEADSQLVDEINRRRGYTVHVTDEICVELRISGVSAVRPDSGEAVRRLVDADLVTTAVGLGVLPRVAPVIAAELRVRKAAGVAAPLNVVACENGVRATSRLKASVYEALDAPTAAWAERTVGFADCSVDRIVPPVAFPEPLDVAAEALADERIFGLVRGAMRQSGEALIRKFGFGRAQHAAYIDSVLRRFRNPWLRDTVARVGHDPARKLSAPLYFSYPITLAAGYGLAVDKLALAAAAALRFDDPADGQCAEIRETIARIGLPAAVRRITGIDDDRLVAVLVDAYARVPSAVGA